MKPIVYCTTLQHGTLGFYLACDEGDFFLFQQSFRQGVNRYFAGGVFLDTALDFSSARNDFAIINTMEKLPKYIRYAEKEYGFAVLDQTIRKQKDRRCAA